MANCLSCGRSLGGTRLLTMTCPECASDEKLKDIRKELARSTSFEEFARIQEQGFERMSASTSEGLSSIASAIEWGFENLSWRLHEQTDLLRSIDQTLKKPRETEAAELRQEAEELRNRSVLEESQRQSLLALSEKRFLLALEKYLLDYRTYVGLAFTYLDMGRVERAKEYFEKSLPHTTIDFYKSYSYRCIGRIYFGREDYDKAAECLGKAIDLSPEYVEGHYDYSQYCALIGNKRACLNSLREAIIGKPFYYRLAKKERSFEPIQSSVNELLSNMTSEALQSGQQTVSDLEKRLELVKKPVSIAQQVFKKVEAQGSAASSQLYLKAKSRLNSAKQKLETADYVDMLKTKRDVVEAISMTKKAKDTATEEYKNYSAAYKHLTEERLRNEEERSKKTASKVCLIIFVVCAIAGTATCTGNSIIAAGNEEANFFLIASGGIGIVGGAILAVLIHILWMIWLGFRYRW